MKLALNSVTAQWLVPLLIALASMIGSGAVAYSKTNARITALETHQQDDSSRLDRIESKVDKILFALTGVRSAR